MLDPCPARIAQIGIAVRSLEDAKAFYGGKLGLPHLFDAEPRMAFFQCGETRLALSEGPGGGEAQRTIVYYGVADAAEAHRQLVEAGAADAQGPRAIAAVEGRELWLAFCLDPDGNPVGLMSGG